METYNFKMIISDSHIESYDYKDTEIKTGFSRGQDKTRRGHTKAGTRQIIESLGKEGYAAYKEHEGRYLVNKEAEYNFDPVTKQIIQKQKAQSSLSRTRNEMRRKINANPTLLTFLTLTFAKSMPEVKKANAIFNRFILRMRKKFKDFKYIAVIEFQRDEDYHGNIKPGGGSVHYHLLCDLDISALTTKAKTRAYERDFAKNYWKNGFVTIKPAEHVDNIGAYFCKYLSKDMFDERMFRKKKYFCSQNLQKPIEIKGDKARFLLDKYLPETKLLFEKELNSKWVGRIEYKNYKAKNNDLFLGELAKIKNIEPRKVETLSVGV